MERAALFSLTVWLLEKIIVTEDSMLSLKAILEHTLFNTHEELLAQFDDIPGKKGTRVLIWNIHRYGAGVLWEGTDSRGSFWTVLGLGGLGLLLSSLGAGGTTAGVSPSSVGMTECSGCPAVK